MHLELEEESWFLEFLQEKVIIKLCIYNFLQPLSPSTGALEEFIKCKLETLKTIAFLKTEIPSRIDKNLRDKM